MKPRRARWLLLLAVLSAGCEVRPSTEANPVTSGNRLLDRLKSLADSGVLTGTSVQKAIGWEVPFEGYNLGAMGSQVDLRTRSFALRCYKKSDCPNSYYSEVSIEEMQGDPIGNRATLRLKADTICVTKDALKRAFGGQLRENILPPVPDGSDRGVWFKYTYLSSRGISLDFVKETEQPCASSSFLGESKIVKWRRQDSVGEWTKEGNNLVDNARFIDELLPISESGDKLQMLGFVCKRSEAISSIVQCDCPDMSKSKACRYDVKVSKTSPPGSFFFAVTPRK